MPNDLYLKIDDTVIKNWYEVSIDKSMQNLCSEFSFSFAGSMELYNVLSGNSTAEVFIGNEKICTGYIFSVSPKINNKTFTINIRGREKTADLVDCSAVNNPGTWNNVDLQRIVYDLCNPGETPYRFNIRVIRKIDVGGAFEQWSINTGETAADAIFRACSMRSILPMTNKDGDIELTVTSDDFAHDSLVYGKNILEADSTIKLTNLYSHYVAKAQEGSKPGEAWDKNKISVYAEAFDSNITRYRPLQLRIDDKATQKYAQEKVNWEAQVRSGKSSKTTVKVKEWEQGNGKLWDINTLVYINIPLFNLDGNLLISDVNFTYSNAGRETLLTLMEPLVFQAEPPKEVKEKTKKVGKTNVWLQ